MLGGVQPQRYAFDPTGATLLVVSADGSCRTFAVGALHVTIRVCANAVHGAMQLLSFNAGTGRLEVDFVARAGAAASTQACTCFCWASPVQQVRVYCSLAVS